VFRLTIVPSTQLLLTPVLTNGTVDLVWTTEAAGTYQLQYTSDLTSTNWVNVGGAVIAGGTNLSATDPVTNAPRRFYRVVRLP
jgi:hypothetical protein